MKSDFCAVSINAVFAQRAVGNDLDNSLASYSKEVLAKLDEMAANAIEKLRKLEPEAEWKQITGKDLLPVFLEFINGREYQDPEEFK